MSDDSIVKRIRGLFGPRGAQEDDSPHVVDRINLGGRGGINGGDGEPGGVVGSGTAGTGGNGAGSTPRSPGNEVPGITITVRGGQRGKGGLFGRDGEPGSAFGPGGRGGESTA